MWCNNKLHDTLKGCVFSLQSYGIYCHIGGSTQRKLGTFSEWMIALYQKYMYELNFIEAMITSCFS